MIFDSAPQSLKGKGLTGILVPALIGLMSFTQAQAATIIGGSSLLNTASADQLQSWLGEGSLTLTNIFTKGVGDNSTTFHNAVDGKGRTFVVLSASEDLGTGGTAIIGGYNPQSWESFNTHLTPLDSERTAFIYNLSTSTLLRQSLTGHDPTNSGQYQTANFSGFGPVFGAGADIWVDGTLTLGYSWNYSYGGDAVIPAASIIDGSSWSGADVLIGGLEVFTISISAVPEPETYAMLLAGLGLLGFAARRRKKQSA